MKSPENFIKEVCEDWEMFLALFLHFEKGYKKIDDEVKRDKLTMLALVFWLGRVYGQEEIRNGKESILDESSASMQSPVSGNT